MFRKLLLLVTALICSVYANDDAPGIAGCEARMHPIPEHLSGSLQCANIGFDGRSFIEVIGNWSIAGPGLDMYEPRGFRVQNETTPEFLKKIRHLSVYSLGRKVNFGENPFEPFPNLQSLEIWKSHERNWTPEITIPADAFGQTPQLKRIGLQHLLLSDSTIQALASLKDQLEDVQVAYLNPDGSILTELVNFTKVRQLDVQGMCTDRDFPTAIFEKSASTLEVIFIQKCSTPKITKELFSSMPNLERLVWEESNITEIEPESFDANPKITFLHMCCNKIQPLPDGIFSHLKNLTDVDFRGNGLTGLSRANFSHVENYNSSFRYYRD